MTSGVRTLFFLNSEWLQNGLSASRHLANIEVLLYSFNVVAFSYIWAFCRFLPRDAYALRICAVYAVLQCLSVCLSVTLVYCVETTELIVKQLALDCGYGHETWNILSLGDLLIGGVKWERSVEKVPDRLARTERELLSMRHNK